MDHSRSDTVEPATRLGSDGGDPIDGIAALGGYARVSDWVRAVAREHGVSHEPSPVHIHADGRITLGDGGEMDFDIVERLLLALTREGVVTQFQVTRLHAAYLQQAG